MEDNLFQQRTELDDLNRSVEELKAEIGKVIVGQDAMIELLLAGILADGHILIEGVPGVAKTLTAKLLSRAISVNFSRIQFTPDLMPSDVDSVLPCSIPAITISNSSTDLSLAISSSSTRSTAHLPRPRARSLKSWKSARSPWTARPTVCCRRSWCGHAESHRTGRDLSSAGSPAGSFLFKISVQYPSQQEEFQIVSNHHLMKGDQRIDTVNPVLTAARIQELRDKVRGLHVEEKLIHFITAIVAATRNHKSIYLGASPRASIGILNGSKAIAGHARP